MIKAKEIIQQRSLGIYVMIDAEDEDFFKEASLEYLLKKDDTLGVVIKKCMEQYAQQKCKEQRDIIFHKFMSGTCKSSSCAIKAIKKAPEPNFD